MLEDITAGPDGALWFTGVPGEVGRITTAGVVTEFATPNFTPAFDFAIVPTTTITTGPDGNLWLTENTAAIGRITPTGIFTAFDVPGNFYTIAGLTSGPGGNLWFTEQEDGSTRGEQPAVGEITPTGVTKPFALPQGTTLDPNLGVAADPTAITTGPDGALWFGENGAIGRITTAGMIQQFPLPMPKAIVEDIAEGPGGAVWFVQQVIDANDEPTCSIGRITTGGTITEYPLPAADGVGGITEGPNGDLWFTEDLIIDPNNPLPAKTAAIGRITPQGEIKTFVLPKKAEVFPSVGNITVGPDGNLWFPFSYHPNLGATTDAIGRITAKGNVKIYSIFATKSYGSYPPAPPSEIISGPDGKLWFEGTVHGTTGIARISTGGKLGPVIPAGGGVSFDFIDSNLVRLPDGQVWFEDERFASVGNQLAVATRSGIVATQDLPASSPSLGGGLTIGPHGTLWATGTSSIVRISGLDTVAGGLDYRHRPKQAPDYSDVGVGGWTNVSSTATPTFAGVARPGALVTLWAEKQGDSQPLLIGRVKASNSDGSWTLTSHVNLSDGDYAVTAKETGHTGPPSVLYSLEADSSGSLSNALVIQAPHGG